MVTDNIGPLSSSFLAAIVNIQFAHVRAQIVRAPPPRRRSHIASVSIALKRALFKLTTYDDRRSTFDDSPPQDHVPTAAAYLSSATTPTTTTAVADKLQVAAVIVSFGSFVRVC